MSVKWYPYPSLMTTFLDGRWLCTVRSPAGLIVTPLNLTHDTWRYDSGKKLKPLEKVIAVSYVPDPYEAPT